MTSLIQTLAIAEYLNFRHAVSALGVTQSSVSARVKALEEDLGVLLFERHARGVGLTEASRHFIQRVTTGIDHLDHAVRAARMVAGGEQGSLRIGTRRNRRRLGTHAYGADYCGRWAAEIVQSVLPGDSVIGSM